MTPHVLRSHLSSPQPQVSFVVFRLLCGSASQRQTDGDHQKQTAERQAGVRRAHTLPHTPHIAQNAVGSESNQMPTDAVEIQYLRE